MCGGYFLKQMYQAQSLWYAGKLSWSGQASWSGYAELLQNWLIERIDITTDSQLFSTIPIAAM